MIDALTNNLLNTAIDAYEHLLGITISANKTHW